MGGEIPEAAKNKSSILVRTAGFRFIGPVVDGKSNRLQLMLWPLCLQATAPATHQIGDWVGHRASLNTVSYYFHLHSESFSTTFNT